MPGWGSGQFWYPPAGVIPDVAGDMLKAAKREDIISGAGIGFSATTAARLAKVTNLDAFVGFLDYDAQLDTVFQYIGSTNWRVFWAPRNLQRRTASQSLSSTTTQSNLNWDTAVLPLTSLFTLVAGVFTAQRVCTLEVKAVIDFAANATGSRAGSILKNGTAIVPGGANSVGSNSGSIDTTFVLDATVTLAVNDTLAVSAAQTSGGSLGVTGSVTINQIG